MILFSKQKFGHRRIGVVITHYGVHFKLVEILRVLFDANKHTLIDEAHVRVFDEFPHTKYVTLDGLLTLTELSPRRPTSEWLRAWALNYQRFV